MTDALLPRASAVLLIGLLGGTAAADVHCRAITGGAAALEGIDAGERIAFIQRELRTGARKARIWSWSWTATYGALATYQLLSATVIDRSHGGQVDGWVGAASAALGVVTLQAMPLKVVRDARWLDRRLRLAPPGVDPCALLAEAEGLLARDAASEEFGSGPLVHAGNLAFNFGLAVLLGVGFGRWQTAGITAAAGTLIGELEIFTQPTHSVDALRRYRGALLDERRARPGLAWSLAPAVAGAQWGLQLSVAF